MKKIINIKSDYDNVLKVFYTMTTACPYSCRYCPDELHNGKNQRIDLDELREFFQKFSDRKILLNLTGGEPTQHPQFKDVVFLAKSLGIRVASDTSNILTYFLPTAIAYTTAEIDAVRKQINSKIIETNSHWSEI
jgi:organic radical activating enzyme